MSDILKQFEDLGCRASFHFADDSGKEFSTGWDKQRQAEALFINNPELRDEMITIAKKFLWTLQPERLTKNS
jgi:hypothetical protein